MYYDEDFYNEPSEYDIMVDKFKQSLLKSVKREFLEEMDKLRKENEELQEIKKNWNKIRGDYIEKELKLNTIIEDEKQKIIHMRLSELFKNCGMNIILYKSSVTCVQGDKCNKCNNQRQIEYTTPSGRKMTETCDCAKPYHIYYPQEHTMVGFYGYDRLNEPLEVTFNNKTTDNYSRYSQAVETIYQGQSFDELYTTYGEEVFFKEADKCLEYCLYINNKKKNPKKLIEKYCIIDEEN